MQGDANRVETRINTAVSLRMRSSCSFLHLAAYIGKLAHFVDVFVDESWELR